MYQDTSRRSKFGRIDNFSSLNSDDVICAYRLRVEKKPHHLLPRFAVKVSFVHPYTMYLNLYSCTYQPYWISFTLLQQLLFPTKSLTRPVIVLMTMQCITGSCWTLIIFTYSKDKNYFIQIVKANLLSEFTTSSLIGYSSAYKYYSLFGQKLCTAFPFRKQLQDHKRHSLTMT